MKNAAPLLFTGIYFNIIKNIIVTEDRQKDNWIMILCNLRTDELGKVGKLRGTTWKREPWKREPKLEYAPMSHGRAQLARRKLLKLL